MSTALGGSFKDGLLLVVFKTGLLKGGAPTFYYYTDWSKTIVNDGSGSFSPTLYPPVEIYGFTYLSVPNLEVILPKNAGTVEDTKIQVVMPLFPDGDASGFVDKASNGEPHSPVFVYVYEAMFDPLVPATPGSTVSVLTLFKGRVEKTVRRYGGKSDRVMFEAGLIKTQLHVPMGIAVNNQCAWKFGEPNSCKFGIEAFKQIGVITAISGKTITIPTLIVPAAPGGTAGKFFHRGYVTILGLNMLIRDFDPAAPTVLTLVREPPAAWLGAAATVYPGCDKTVSTCDKRWANKLNFGGFGSAIPSHNPLYEIQ